MDKRIYVSDVHMGAGRSLDKPNVYDWLGRKEAIEFAGFLTYLADRIDVSEVILLGDTMDNWVCPVDEAPPTFDEILKAGHNKEIVKNLKALTEKKKVLYLPGNHDMQVTEKLISEYFPEIVFGGKAGNKSSYRTSRLVAEHGSSYAMFNAPDPINSPGKRLPLGYYISRIAATKTVKTGDSNRHWWTYFDDILELLGPQKLPQSAFEAILEEAGLNDDTKIQMKAFDSNVPNDDQKSFIKASDIKHKYANLYEQWESHYEKGMAFKAVMAEIGYLGDIADNLCKKGDTNIVIFGHSHDSELDKDSWFTDDRIYANCGAWCDEDKPSSFVETEKDTATNRYNVRLFDWKEGKAVQKNEQFVEL